MNKSLLTEHGCHPPQTGFVLARNWDRLGGRVHEILNAYVAAKILGLEFRFLWPEEKRFPEVCEQIWILSRDFIRQHRLFEEQLRGWRELGLPPAQGQSVEAFKSGIAEFPEKHYLRYQDFFKIPQFSGLDSYALFTQSALEILSPEVLEMDKKVRNRLEELGASKVLHLRYGDILNGAFRHYPDPDKYFPYCLACRMSAQKESGDRFIVLSDTPEIPVRLSKSEGSCLTSEQLRGPDRSEDTFEHLIYDLLIMKNCSTVLAPSLSAFSQLGTHLGGREAVIVSVGSQVKDFPELLTWLDRKDLYKDLPAHIAGPLFARDVAQIMNTHSNFTDLNTWLRIASKAVSADPQYVVGSAQLAVVYSFLGDHFRALEILHKSQHFAQEVRETHEDPLVYLTVVEIFCLALKMVQEMRKGRPARARLLFDQLLSLMQQLRTLAPFQVPLSGIIQCLEESSSSLKSELQLLESRNRLQLAWHALKHNQILRLCPEKSIRYLSGKMIFDSLHRNPDQTDFLIMLAGTLRKLSNLGE